MSQETILVVDDNQKFAQSLIKYMLLPLGYKVAHAKNGQIGLDMAVKHQPDLILLDMNMPRMTGLGVLAALRQTDCDAPVIFMTAEGSENVAVEAFRLGVKDYLVKPFSPDELQQAVDSALQEIRLTRQKEKLERDLLISETVRQTVVTLSHYLNNYLVVLNGNIFLAQEGLPAQLPNHAELIETLEECEISVAKIEAVIKVLQKITNVKLTAYHGQVKMLDIENALKKELQKIKLRTKPRQADDNN
ncbi:MAG TPA: response regulator [Anaerolineae bacterium]|nr:response regulator [Anaerolineae bacterium]MCB0179433.1 response regulator [Anaerolineae bacterium]MCB0222141.1 response regulator [Anaerolineae bacterium]MCB9103134.1 response regulator [Anaerolineales bacterium]HRV90638.1 response regulator [Anaerolineae bacterium]